jgi:hypothetical protein
MDAPWQRAEGRAAARQAAETIVAANRELEEQTEAQERRLGAIRARGEAAYMNGPHRRPAEPLTVVQLWARYSGRAELW